MRALICFVALVLGCGAPVPTAAPSVTPPTSASPAPPTPSPTDSLVTATPTAVATPTAAPTPTTAPTPTPSGTPAATPVATPTSTPADAWTDASVISTDHYTQIALVVDASGVVHAAGNLRNSIWYLTDGAGSWTSDRLSNPPGSEIDEAPAIAGNGSSLTVAFTRRFNTPFGAAADGIYLVERDAGDWSAPTSFGEGAGNSPSLQWRDGHLYVAYREGEPIDVVEEGDEFPIRFASNRTGSWVDVVVSPNGTRPSLALTGTGQARMVFGDWDQLLPAGELGYASQASLPSTDFSVTPVPETDSYDSRYALAHDGSRAHLVYAVSNELFYRLRTLAGGWDEPVTLMADGSFSSVAVATDTDNHVHVVATTRSDGVWYFTNRHGAWESRQLLAPAAAEWFVADSSIDVDPSGRAHILFLGGTNRRTTNVWYAVSPAS